MKNEKAKTRPVENPYEIYVRGYDEDRWEWRILKHYQSAEGEAKNQYARVFCAVKSPYTYGDYELGDVYLRDIKQNADKVSLAFAESLNK